MIEIKIDDQHLVSTLNQLAANVADLSPIMRAVAGIMHHAVMENFDKSGRPAWAPLKPATLAAKKKQGYGEKTLIRRGTLRSSITQNSDRTSAVVGTNLVYAAIHQFGGNIGIPARSQQAYFKQNKDGSVGNLFVRKGQSNFAQWHTRGAHTIGIPARPFLKLTERASFHLMQIIFNVLTAKSHQIPANPSFIAHVTFKYRAVPHEEAVTAALLKQAEQAAAAGVEIDVRRFAIAA